MAFNFWEAQRRARSKTTLYLTLFIILTLGVGIGVELVMYHLLEGYNSPIPFFGIGFVLITFAVAGYEYSVFLVQGGKYVAKLMDGVEIREHTNHPEQRQILNIVNEMAIAASVPVPEVYLINAEEINAFTAGTKPENTVIAITTGALKRLSRDELQAVIAHEFGHIYNGDVKISMRLAAMVMGFYILFYLGIRLMQIVSTSGDERRKSNLYLIPLVLMLAGAITWFFGSILKASVSREREYLADACSVQFTRNPDGIISALKSIEGQARTPKLERNGMGYSHMFFDDRSWMSSLFATHPPLAKRIEAIEGKEYFPEEWKKDTPG